MANFRALGLRPLGLLTLLVLAGCSTKTTQTPTPRPAQVKAQLVDLIPSNVRDRQGWAKDIAAAFTAQDIPANA